MKRILFFAITFALLFFVSQSYAQLVPSSKVVEFKAFTNSDVYLPGASYRILFSLSFDETFHGQSNKPTLEGLIPTTLTIDAPAGVTVGRIVYPKAKMVKFAFSDEALSTYEGEVFFGTTVAIAPELSVNEIELVSKLTVQACNDNSCLPPSTITTPIKMIIGGSDAQVSSINKDVFDRHSGIFSNETREGANLGELEISFESKGLLLTCLLVFLSGLALNLTPCVYPLIPITVAYFGGQGESKKGKLLVHALLYLLGMAAMYSSLGLFAALTGSLFGALLQHWLVILLIVSVMVALALSMFGLYEITVPSSLAQIGGKNRKGFFGTFMMGLTVGIIAAPCIGPFVIGLLTFVGERQDPFLGFLLFFLLALGLGLPFVVIAIFSGSLSSLPRSGAWMIVVKKIFGVILLGMAIYFAEPLVSETVHLYLYRFLLIGAGIYFIIFLPETKSDPIWVKAIIALIVAAGVYMMTPSNGEDKPGIEWAKGDVATVDGAITSGENVIIDFSADWCLPCKELDHFTFADKEVFEKSKEFKTIKVDVTSSDDLDSEKLKQRFNIAGVPTILFLRRGGEEASDLRVIGFVDAEEFLRRMEILSQ